MNKPHAEIAFEAMLLGISLTEATHNIEHGATLQASLADLLLEVANGQRILYGDWCGDAPRNAKND